MSCTRCPWESRVRLSTVDLEHLYALRARNEAAGVAQEKRHGQRNVTTINQRREIERLIKAQEELLPDEQG